MGYQLTQQRNPIATNGTLVVDQSPFSIRKIQLEQDTAKVLGEQPNGRVELDFNRAGVPLIEVVTDPIFRDPGTALRFAHSLYDLLLEHSITSDSIESGSFRVDANVSISEDPEYRVEVKNVMGFKFLEKALGIFSLANPGRLRIEETAICPTKSKGDSVF